jgi:hypothetical protein
MRPTKHVEAAQAVVVRQLVWGAVMLAQTGGGECSSTVETRERLNDYKSIVCGPSAVL